VRENIDAIQETTEALSDASKKVGLEVNPEKTKYSIMLMPRYQKVGQKHRIKTANRSFEEIQIFGNNIDRSKLLEQRD
jgi:hypothetical protein